MSVATIAKTAPTYVRTPVASNTTARSNPMTYEETIASFEPIFLPYEGDAHGVYHGKTLLLNRGYQVPSFMREVRCHLEVVTCAEQFPGRARFLVIFDDEPFDLRGVPRRTSLRATALQAMQTSEGSGFDFEIVDPAIVVELEASAADWDKVC